MPAAEFTEISTTTTPGLSRRVQTGYGSSSVATGAFETVPGLMLLPFLTDTSASPPCGRG